MNRRRTIACAGVAIAFLGLAIPGAWLQYSGSLGKLDLTAAQRGSTIVVDREGRLLRAFTTPDGRWRLPVTAREVDPHFIDLLVDYEDRHFAEHKGVDFKALGRAALQLMSKRHVVSGGSTLTMQVARLLEPREERSIAAKLRQIVRAFEIERRLTKAEILDLYFALAPYGGNLEGVRAASLSYFGKEPRRLSIAEAALLVALPQSPEMRRPDRFAQAGHEARQRVIERAFEHGLISATERDAANAEILPRERRPFPFLAAHASEAAVHQEAAHHENLHDESPSRILRLSLDAKLQASLEALARDTAQKLGPKISAAIIVIDNTSGEMRAHVGSADFFSQERAGSIDMIQAIRSPGSTLKPFIYALAFETGIAHPETMLDDRPTRYGVYAPENFDLSFQGTVTARRALQLSLNVPAVELLAEIGPARFLARLRNAGADIVLSKEAAPGLAVGLGGLGIRLSDLARLYAGLARGGSVPRLIERLGELPSDKSDLRRIAEPVASWYVADILRGAPPPLNAPAGRLAFKTGTSYGYRDAYAIGFDKSYTVAVWIGRPDNAAVPGLVGRQIAAPVLFDAFARLGSSYEFPLAPADVLVSHSAALPPPLRHLRKDMPKTLAANATAQLRIVYPPDGARVDLGLSDRMESTNPLALKAQGGVPPLTWLVNGAPVNERDPRRQSTWVPDGAGFARVSVIDAKGASDSVQVRLE
jgi:penicillin-binding protein 1C